MMKDIGTSSRWGTSESDKILFDELRKIKRSFGFKPNKDKVVIALIKALISVDINIESRFVGIIESLGFKPHHVKTVLHGNEGEDPDKHLWERDFHGRYGLHD